MKIIVHHPRPQLQATAHDPGTDFKAVFRRLERQWLAPSDPTSVVEGLTWADLREMALEVFSAGGVRHAVVQDNLRKKLPTPAEFARRS